MSWLCHCPLSCCSLPCGYLAHRSVISEALRDWSLQPKRFRKLHQFYCDQNRRLQQVGSAWWCLCLPTDCFPVCFVDHWTALKVNCFWMGYDTDSNDAITSDPSNDVRRKSVFQREMLSRSRRLTFLWASFG